MVTVWAPLQFLSRRGAGVVTGFSYCVTGTWEVFGGYLQHWKGTFFVCVSRLLCWIYLLAGGCGTCLMFWPSLFSWNWLNRDVDLFELILLEEVLLLPGIAADLQPCSCVGQDARRLRVLTSFSRCSCTTPSPRAFKKGSPGVIQVMLGHANSHRDRSTSAVLLLVSFDCGLVVFWAWLSQVQKPSRTHWHRAMCVEKSPAQKWHTSLAERQFEENIVMWSCRETSCSPRSP